jgi:hypothetical protein
MDIVNCIGSSGIVLGGLAAASFLVLLVLGSTTMPTSRIITAKMRFDVKTSWVSNTTLFSTVLVSTLKDNYIPKPDAIKPEGILWLGGLYLVFAALAVLALLVYFASERAVKVKGGASSKEEYEYHYHVGWYFFAAILALWAAEGQLFTLAATVLIAKPNYVDVVAKSIFVSSVVFAALAVGVYAFKTMTRQLESEVEAQKTRAELVQLQKKLLETGDVAAADALATLRAAREFSTL